MFTSLIIPAINFIACCQLLLLAQMSSETAATTMVTFVATKTKAGRETKTSF